VSHDDVTIATVVAVCAALSLAPAVWAWWTVRGTQPAGVGAGLLTVGGTVGLIAWGGPLLVLPVAAATAIPVLARRHLGRRGRTVTAVVLTVCTVVFALASVVIVWLAILDVNCPPEASDCL
jgi:hypothetical protein